MARLLPLVSGYQSSIDTYNAGTHRRQEKSRLINFYGRLLLPGSDCCIIGRSFVCTRAPTLFFSLRRRRRRRRRRLPMYVNHNGKSSALTGDRDTRRRRR